MLPVPIMSFGAAIEGDVFWELIYVNDHDVNLRLMKQKRASISFFQFGNPHICWWAGLAFSLTRRLQWSPPREV